MASRLRPEARGKFIYLGDEKLYVRGVTYGTFRPGQNGDAFHAPEIVERDFAEIASSGMNAVRTYTVPPRWLLDAARRHGLWVLVGIPWEQHSVFLDGMRRAHAVEIAIRTGVDACRGHSAVLAFAIGNEIPAPIVRWTGARRIERFLSRLARAVRDEDPGALVAYVNYPSTEYLDLPFVDLVCFNIYIESEPHLEGYLARLQNLAGQRPLLMTELGLDSRRNGLAGQAKSLAWQVRATFAAGCAGAFVFAWTDEWYRGGHDIQDWDFGLTTRERQPKPALAAVRHAFADTPFASGRHSPRISVVVCSYNGERVIRDCFEGLCRLDYTDFEVVVVDDGSTDRTADIAREYIVDPRFRLIRTENRGLSSARNVGLHAATGDIVAYIDDDAYPDRDWLTYLAAAFKPSKHAGIGGPNLPPTDDGFIAGCVARAPGGPVHVLISDREAEHIPGCNMAFRREALLEIGGFDPQFRTAGDDVDVCWRLQRRGWTLGFSPAAVVWHHRRNSIRAYWRQQQGYGKAEALLERKWPEEYNSLGHLSWSGRIYGDGHPRRLGLCGGRIYQGIWGSAPFQSVYESGPGLWSMMPAMPDWGVVILALAVLSVLGLSWPPLLAAVPLLALALGASIMQAIVSTSHARVRGARAFALTAFLHLIQPLARLWGRASFGLTPWRRRCTSGMAAVVPRQFAIWSEKWRPAPHWLERLEAEVRAHGAVSIRGGDFDRWDLAVRAGSLAEARVLMAIEEHGSGKQWVRFRVWPRCTPWTLVLLLLIAILANWAEHDKALLAGGVLGMSALVLVAGNAVHCSAAIAAALRALHGMTKEEA